MENESKYIIYGLFCPFTDEIYYVGKSSVGLFRPLQYLNDSHSDKITEWVEGLKKIGHLPDIRILERAITDSELRDKERFWIYKFIAEGKTLLNIQSVSAANVLKKIKSQILLNDDSIPTPVTPTETIGAYVKRKRKIAKLSQPELARKAGVGVRFLRELEQGKETLRIDKIIVVLRLFGATIIPHEISAQ